MREKQASGKAEVQTFFSCDPTELLVVGRTLSLLFQLTIPLAQINFILI